MNNRRADARAENPIESQTFSLYCGTCGGVRILTINQKTGDVSDSPNDVSTAFNSTYNWKVVASHLGNKQIRTDLFKAGHNSTVHNHV